MELKLQGSQRQEDNVRRVRVEPERTGWAKLYDLIRQFDKDRVADVKEDIDTLLVFVRPFSYPAFFATDQQ